MTRIVATAAMTAILAAGTAAGARAQQPQQPQPPQQPQQPQQNFLAVGTMAPDISFTGATRYGLLAEPVRVSQFRGQTVVIAFFFRARSPG